MAGEFPDHINTLILLSLNHFIEIFQVWREVVLRICAPQRECWSPGSRRGSITTTVNLNRKLGYFFFFP